MILISALEQALNACPPIPGLLSVDPKTFSLHVFESVPSTNQVLGSLLKTGGNEGTVAIAQQQTAGRGQWGRHWQSTVGGLYLSLALAPNLDAQKAHQLVICCSWGVALALQQQGIPVQIKWPNDLVLDHRKLGGMLLETRSQHQRLHSAIIGLGLNWQNAVPDSGISLHHWLTESSPGAIASLEQLAALVLHGIMGGYRQWQQTGIESILPHYHQVLTRIGSWIPVSDGMGKIVGVSEQGELIVEMQTDSTDERSTGDRHPSSPTTAPGMPQLRRFPPGSIRLGYEC